MRPIPCLPKLASSCARPAAALRDFGYPASRKKFSDTSAQAQRRGWNSERAGWEGARVQAHSCASLGAITGSFSFFRNSHHSEKRHHQNLVSDSEYSLTILPKCIHTKKDLSGTFGPFFALAVTRQHTNTIFWEKNVAAQNYFLMPQLKRNAAVGTLEQIRSLIKS